MDCFRTTFNPAAVEKHGHWSAADLLIGYNWFSHIENEKRGEFLYSSYIMPNIFVQN